MLRKKCVMLEHMQQKEGLTIKEDASIDEVGSRGECASIVQHAEPIDLSALTMDKDKHGIIQQVRRLEKGRQAITFAKSMSKKVEYLERKVKVWQLSSLVWTRTSVNDCSVLQKLNIPCTTI